MIGQNGVGSTACALLENLQAAMHRSGDNLFLLGGEVQELEEAASEARRDAQEAWNEVFQLRAERDAAARDAEELRARITTERQVSIKEVQALRERLHET